jgi:hypothetical protein
VLAIGAAAVVVGGAAVAFADADTVLLPVCVALLGAAAAYALDEPASAVVDVTPTSLARRAAVRALAVPPLLAAGAATVLAVLARGSDLPLVPTGLALLGNVVLGFAVACIIRARVGEPGPFASAAVALASMAPALMPRLPGWLRTFPVADARAQPSNALWSGTLAVCAVLVVFSLSDRSRHVGAGRVRAPRRKVT